MQVARKYVVRRRKEKFNPWHVSFWRYIASYLGHGAWSKPGRCKYLMSCWVQSIVLRAVHGIINPWPCVLDLLSPHPTPLLLRPSAPPPSRLSALPTRILFSPRTWNTMNFALHDTVCESRYRWMQITPLDSIAGLAKFNWKHSINQSGTSSSNLTRSKLIRKKKREGLNYLKTFLKSLRLFFFRIICSIIIFILF